MKPPRKWLRLIGRKGGQAKVPKGIATLTPKQRREISARGVAARKANKEAQDVETS